MVVQTFGDKRKTLYVKPFEDQFGAREKIRRKEGVLATWDIRSKILGGRAMWKTLPVMWIKR